MNAENKKTLKDILQNLPSDIKELAELLPPKYLEAANFYLSGSSKNVALVRAKLLKHTDTDQKKGIKSSNIFSSGLMAEYMAAVRDYQCSETIMDLHEIDIRLSKIARTDKTDVVSYRSEPVYSVDEEGEEVLVGYRSRPYLRPLEELSERERTAIKSIKQTKTGLEVEMHDPMKAMDMLIKRKGGYTENVNNNITADKKVHAFMPDNGRGPGSKSSDS